MFFGPTRQTEDALLKEYDKISEELIRFIFPPTSQIEDALLKQYDKISEEFILTPAEEAMEDWPVMYEYVAKCRKCGWGTVLSVRHVLQRGNLIHDCLDAIAHE